MIGTPRSAIALVLVLGLTGCGGRAVSAAGPHPPSVADTFPVGSTAPFALFAHCGVEFTTIDGTLWRTRVRDDGNHNPPPGWPQNIQGTLRRPAEDRAVFVSDEIPDTLVFRPAPHARYSCD